MRIGIDVGGTHTDAALLSGNQVVETCKVLTTSDVMSGILDVLTQLQSQCSETVVADAIMIGTTQFTNAVIERRSLKPVAAIRLGAPSGKGLPPFVGWPEDIANTVCAAVYELEGGYLYDGQELSPLNEVELKKVIEDLKRRNVEAVAITSAFSPMNSSPEQWVKERVQQALPHCRITLSHEIGRVGLLERENAAILNASLLHFADDVITALEMALKNSQHNCPVFISQNDGTLMDVSFARRFPALTFASGPTNSLRGAAKLTGLDEAIVIDIGGTTTDFGVLRGGFPRESNLVVEVGGVRTNFRMPDILAIGLGGGSLVAPDGSLVGPQSVGHQLVNEGLVFGGSTLTASDIAVAAGQVSMGDISNVGGLDNKIVSRALEQIRTMLNAGVRKMNPGKNPLPVVLVGGGAAIVPDSLSAGFEVLRPEYCDVANAIGAAIAQIGGEAERFVSYQTTERETAIEQVRSEAINKAVAAGADMKTIRVNDIEEVAIPYMDNGSTRVRVKVIGDVAALQSPDTKEAAR